MMLEVACRRCERRGRLRIDRLIEQHGAHMGLPELCDVLARGCPRVEAVAVGERCSVFYPQLLHLWERTGKCWTSFDAGGRADAAGVSANLSPAQRATL